MRRPLALLVVILCLPLAACSAPAAPNSVPSSSSSAAAVPQPAPTARPTPTFDRGAESLTDPNSLWVIVDKRSPLTPRSYVPPDLVAVPVPHTNAPQLRRVAASAVVRMFAAAQHVGLDLASNSAYRSFASQTTVYDEDLHAHGRAAADTLTARPGYSEHQTGLAIDIGAVSGRCSLSACFASTPEGEWLARNAWRFGFVLRYPKGYTNITGYDFEPWHYRYVGDPLAARLHESGTPTLERFFGLPAAPEYPKG